MTGAEAHGTKAEPTPEWMIRTFGSVAAWQKSRTRCRHVKFGRKRKPAIYCRLLPVRRSGWLLPCPDRPIPEHVRQAVGRAVTGVGERPRLEYEVDGARRVAIGRVGESADSLRMDLVRTYGLVYAVELRQSDDALAEYVAAGGNYRSHARRLGMRDESFLAKSVDAAEVERSVLLSDRQFERVWRLLPTYTGPEDAVIGDPGEWEQDETLAEVVIDDPGGKPEVSAPLPMAIPKADGRGKDNLYFGFALDRGGGRRFKQEEFEPPLRIALGGAINYALGFGRSERVDEWLPYAGDGIQWGRNNPLAPRVVGPDRGPVCDRTPHPEPDGRWYPWLGTAYQVPNASKWESWTRRAAVYERERKKVADREAKKLPADPPCVGGMAKAA